MAAKLPENDMRIEGDFQRDGAVCVRAAVKPEHVELAKEAIEANLADRQRPPAVHSFAARFQG